MRHLTSEHLIDLAEGTRPESSAPHLDACERCREQLAELRTAMAAAADVEVPEPSPLFWDHLSSRVRDAVEADGAPRQQPWFERWVWSRLRLPLAAAAVAAIIIAVIVSPRFSRAPRIAGTQTAPVVPAADVPVSGELALLPSDPSLDLVAALAAEVDWDVAGQMGIGAHQGAADNALSQLTDSERRELQRLLKEELARSGA